MPEPSIANLLLAAVTIEGGVIGVLFWRLVAEMKGRRTDAKKFEDDEKTARAVRLEAALNFVRKEKDNAVAALLAEKDRNRDKVEGFLEEFVAVTKDAAAEMRTLNRNFGGPS